MGRILDNWRIPVAAIFSVAIVFVSYQLAKSISTPKVEASEETALLKAIATKDSDNDGLPDWEEVLYGTNPNLIDTRGLGMTDGEAVARGLIVPKAIVDLPVATSSPIKTGEYGLPPPPAEGTLTSAFAKSFFAIYLDVKQANGGADLTEAQLADVQNKALKSLTDSMVMAPDFKTARDITVVGGGADALRAFAILAESIFNSNTASSAKGPLAYLSDALQKGDETALENLSSISKAYRGTAAGLAAIQVPSELASDDLALINALARLSEILTDFTRVNSDPLAAIFALAQYPAATIAVSTAFSNIGTLYTNSGIILKAGEPGAEFANFASDVSASQTTTAKK